jgi:cytochrome c biogenesis protein CcmG, thiol:disulfide interchange protein DsbE
MPRTRFDWLSIIVLAAVLGTLWIGLTRVEASGLNPSGRPPSPELGYRAPDFSLETLGGKSIHLRDFAGKPMLINFWATWCGPCRAEIPSLESASRQFGNRAVILGVNVQELPALVAPFVAELGMTYPVVLDTDSSVSLAFRVRAFPTSFFVDAHGVIVQIEAGSISDALILKRLGDLVGD